MPSRGSSDMTAMLRTTESPWRTMTAPFACSATRPVSNESRFPATSTFFVTTATPLPPNMWRSPCGATVGQCPSSCRLTPSAERELLRADPRYRRGSSFVLSPDPELGDEGAIALDVGVPHVV